MRHRRGTLIGFAYVITPSVEASCLQPHRWRRSSHDSIDRSLQKPVYSLVRSIHYIPVYFCQAYDGNLSSGFIAIACIFPILNNCSQVAIVYRVIVAWSLWSSSKPAPKADAAPPASSSSSNTNSTDQLSASLSTMSARRDTPQLTPQLCFSSGTLRGEFMSAGNYIRHHPSTLDLRSSI